MMKTLLLALSIGSATLATAKPSPDSVFETIVHVMQENPDITELEVCVDSVCETYVASDLPRVKPLPKVPSPTAGDGGVAETVGKIVGSVGQTVGMGGRVVVDYEKKADGSVKVHVEASFGTGTGAAAGASGGATQTPPANQ